MLQFLTSLTFLFAFAITVMVWHGIVYYRSFARNGHLKRNFPWVFLSITVACFSFLYWNIHAPLRLQTFSNLDHHFIRHDGFLVDRRIELGKTDTINYPGNAFSRFTLTRENQQLNVSSAYSEEPFYISSGSSFRLLSAVYPASGHSIFFRCGATPVSLTTKNDRSFELHIGDTVFIKTGKSIHYGLSGWNIFRDDSTFINSPWYTNESLINSLQSILLLRDIKGKEAGELNYFLSGRLFRYAAMIKYDENTLQRDKLAFTSVIPDKSIIAWGMGFPEYKKNRFRVTYLGADSFRLTNYYPVSYPMTEENNQGMPGDIGAHPVSKFLVGDTKDIQDLPAVFNEGFLFSVFDKDSSVDFSPVLLSYRKDRANAPLELKAVYLKEPSRSVNIINNTLLLPVKSTSLSWVFSVQNSFDWSFGGWTLPARLWQFLIFGSLFLFFLLVFATSWLKPANQLSWVWQLLSCVSMVMLTTRFFLYWRYKSFPPYEGLDLPSLQQLNSFWNFGVILFAGLALAIIFGFGFLKYAYAFIRRKAALLLNIPFSLSGNRDWINEERLTEAAQKIPFVKRSNAKRLFFGSWTLLLLTGAAVAAVKNFDPTTCRHLALLLVLFYFFYIFISYRYSPLVASAAKSWWEIKTGNALDIIINNPVKILLSVSLLGLFVFVDMGFAIIFLNFLLFNEAFLCINYAIAGLSAGSKKNAGLFAFLGGMYLLLFIVNLLYAPYIFKWLLELPISLYAIGYIFFAGIISYTLVRLMHHSARKKRMGTGLASAVFLFISAFLFFPKERILEKAAITRYRIDVMTEPVEKTIEKAYGEGKTYEPVIRAAQNQWFINTFIYEKNNPRVNTAGFHLLPHAPQNKGAKYNAQATDLVTSRFLIAEHGRWSVLLYVLLLLLPVALLASFYKLYPDFTNRVNLHYPTLTTGFSLLNYLLITALLVILAATGRYIFFGQDLPFGSILSKQSILFPSILLIGVVMLFRNISLERYPNRRKLIPGAIVFIGLALMLFFVKPSFNKNRGFEVTDLAKNMDSYIDTRLQPIFDEIDTAIVTRKLPVTKKDRLFADTLRKLAAAGFLNDAGKFFSKEIEEYSRSGFSRHLDPNRLLYLDLNSGKPVLAVNDNYFRVEPPPHLQQSWAGNVFGDSSNYNITLWDAKDGTVTHQKLNRFSEEPGTILSDQLQWVFKNPKDDGLPEQLCLINRSATSLILQTTTGKILLGSNDTLALRNPDRILFTGFSDGHDRVLVLEPDAFMKNYYVNGSRFYMYPLGRDFIWARNFAESISSGYSAKNLSKKNVFVSLDKELTDSLSGRIRQMIDTDTAYKKGAEYGICIADGNGRLIAMPDFIKEINRPDPNDKAGFIKAVRGENGQISQSLLRKEIGNINLLRLNPGPGSTLKPIVFTAIASQLNLNWDAFAAEGFSQKQHFFGGEKVGEYDFEKNNGRIASVSDYLKYSDNYYHSNILLLGSYSKQDLQSLLLNHFEKQDPEPGLHWPYFSYNGQQYWLNGFENWPGYINGRANFGSDSSFLSIGLFNNYGIYTYRSGKRFDRFTSSYDSSLFNGLSKKSGFILPEYALFDQKGTGMNMSRPNEVFMSSFRGHVKGSSQVMIAPVKMLDAFGKLVTQNRNYSLTLNPYATGTVFYPFYVDHGVVYSNYLSLMRESVFTGMKQALFSGTAARLGSMLKDGSPYYYYAKTGTTGDDEREAKSKLFVIIISQKNITDPDYNFRKNKFYTIYFTSQNGPSRQNEEFQARVIKYVQESAVFKRYMKGRDQ